METIVPTRTKYKSKETDEDIIKQALAFPLQSMRALVKSSLFCFVRYFWDTYSQDLFEPNWHIEKICEELETVARSVAEGKVKPYDLLINQPPGTTKTAIVSVFFPVWCWTNWFWLRFITTSHSSPLSLESAEYSRDIIRSDKFQQMFPDLDIKADKDNKSNFRVVKKTIVHPGQTPRITNGGSRISTSVDARITGFHAHIIIWDDLIDPKRAFSPVEIMAANNYLDQTLSTRKVNKEVSVMIGIMQRLAEGDPTEHLLKKKGKKLRHICLPGEIVNYKGQLKPTEWESYYKDGLLDIKRLSWNALHEMETDLGQFGYASQVGQKPSKPDGNMFKVSHFGKMQIMPPEVSLIKVVRYWDKAGTDEKELKKGQEAAYTVGTKMGILANGKFLIMHVKRGRWSADERERIIKETAMADGANVEIWIEQEPGSGGKESAQGTKRNLAGFMIQSECPQGDKVRRADPYSVQVNEGNVMLLEGEWNDEFIKEHENFPFSKFKDQVDSAAGAFNKLVSKKSVKVF